MSATIEPVAVAILAKAPIPGFAKTRLIPVLGEAGAATLQARLTERAVETATAAGTGPVTLWAAPDARHPAFAHCPALTAEHLRTASDALRAGADVVVIPAEDGGYALIGMRAPQPALFADMRWSTPGVMDETRRRLAQLGLTWREPVTLWDVDVPEDLERLRAADLRHLIPAKTS